MAEHLPLALWPETLRRHDLASHSIAETLAAETEWLDQVDRDPGAACLCLWEHPSHVVIVGRSNVIEREVDVAACAEDNVTILQRASGGGTVLLGPGCLCFALLLPINEDHRRLGVSVITASIMQRLAAALSRPEHAVSVHGVSDLVLQGRKFSGNAQRWRRHALLHHGTVLYDFDLPAIGRYLRFPSRVPEYRDQRSHLDFVRNLDLTREEIMHRLCTAWQARAYED